METVTKGEGRGSETPREITGAFMGGKTLGGGIYAQKEVWGRKKFILKENKGPISGFLTSQRKRTRKG